MRIELVKLLRDARQAARNLEFIVIRIFVIIRAVQIRGQKRKRRHRDVRVHRRSYACRFGFTASIRVRTSPAGNARSGTSASAARAMRASAFTPAPFRSGPRPADLVADTAIAFDVAPLPECCQRGRRPDLAERPCGVTANHRMGIAAEAFRLARRPRSGPTHFPTRRPHYAAEPPRRASPWPCSGSGA